MSQRKIIVPIVVDSSTPTTGDDKESGFVVGMLWLTSTTLYVCTSNAIGAAVWTAFSGGGGGSGTVTSVSMTVPTGFSISGSPITGAGTLAVTLANAVKNKLLIGPITGSDATPTFRVLDKADVKAALAAALVQGTNITITDNGDGTFTIDASGGGAGPSFTTDVHTTTGHGFWINSAPSPSSDYYPFYAVISDNKYFKYGIDNYSTGNQAESGYQAESSGATVILRAVSSNWTDYGGDNLAAGSACLDHTFGTQLMLRTVGYLSFCTNGFNERMRIASNGVISIYSGPMKFQTVGLGIQLKEGTNAISGVATLVGGTVTVSTNKVTANSRIQLTGQNLGTITVPAARDISARTPGTDFTILSANPLDTSDVAWVIVEPS